MSADFADQLLHCGLFALAMVFFLLWAWPRVEGLRLRRPRVITERRDQRLVANHLERTTRGGRHGR